MAQQTTLWLKDPDAVLDWIWDWTDWMNTGEQIVTSEFAISPPGLTLDSDESSLYSATAWLSGGTEGQVYSVGNRITTNQGRTDERTITIRVTNR